MRTTFLREDIALVTAFRRVFLSLLFFTAATAFADSWIRPTPEELSMTAEPAAPGVAAIYLFRDERADDKIHIHSIYVRLKVLTEKGKDYADVEVPYEGRSFNIRSVEGRTIHSDGTIIPFTGKPYEKLLEKTKTTKYKAKVFTLPDVQVGSIIEYRYTLSYNDNLVSSPQWYVQQDIYLRKGHYEFVPTQHELDDGHGGAKLATLAYSPNLPKGITVQYLQTMNKYVLDVENIEAMPQEEYMPPMQSVSYRVLFYYTISKTADDYWKDEGKFWSKDIDKFINSGKLTPVVAQIVVPTDTPDQKLRKIYAAVMKLENTSFTRGHSGAEDKAQGIKIKTAADIWEQKRGNSDEITLLFVGLARAAGLKAYVAAVPNRDRAFFIPSYLEMSQLDDDIAIVEIAGKEQYFDPGERYCAYGELHWKHTMTRGLRQVEHGTEIGQTPGPSYKVNKVSRTADLSIEADGKVHGTVRVTLSGSDALRWRQLGLSTDETEVGKQFEETLQRQVPSGIEIKTNHLLGYADSDAYLMVVLDVKGSMGTATSKRVFLPGSFFEASSAPLFVHDKRLQPVDLNFPYIVSDSVTVRLPPAFTVESTPKDAQIELPQNAVYGATFKQEQGTLHSERVFILGNIIFPVAEYPELKGFYQKVNAKDQEQVVLHPAQAAAGSGAAQ